MAETVHYALYKVLKKYINNKLSTETTRYNYNSHFFLRSR